MAHVVLLAPPFVPRYMRNARCDFVSLSGSNWYPIWLGHAGALLEKHGISTTLIDAPVEELHLDQVITRLHSLAPTTVVIYTGRLSEESDIRVAETIQRSICHDVILVGPYFSIHPEQILQRSKVPLKGIQREFDYPLLHYLQGKPLHSIANFVYQDADRIISNPLAHPLTQAEIDAVPFVSEYLLRQTHFRRYKVPSELHPYMDVMLGRGCAYGQCTFCLWPQTFTGGARYIARSTHLFLDELEWLQRHPAGIRSVMIQDDMLPFAKAREIAIGMIERKIRLPWSCYMKPSSHIPSDVFQLMKQSGCVNIHVGYESGDDDMLVIIKKGNTVADAIAFTQKAHEAGIHIHGDFLIGLPGETRQSAKKTLDLALQLRPSSAQFQIYIPLFPHAPQHAHSSNPDRLSEKEIEAFAKYAYKRFYFNWDYVKKIIRHPKDFFWNRLDTYRAAVPALFWKKWVR